MTVLVLGATGATGKLVVTELLDKGLDIKIIVRSHDNVMPDFKNNNQVDLTIANVHELTVDEMAEHLDGCTAVVSCLGHNLSFQGMFGHPRRLVTDVITTVCEASKKISPEHPIKFILMSTTGYQNHKQSEKVTLKYKTVIALLRLILPPHVDNENAANYLQSKVSNSNLPIEWVAVRPDNLVNHDAATAYKIYSSPQHDPIFNGQKTSRNNVANFMVELLTSTRLWNNWKGKMPVIYNEAQ